MCNDTKKMLIVGNGLSRLAYKKEIQNFKGEVWIFNYAYKEKWLAKIATRWHGHEELIPEVQEAREKNGYKYKIYGGTKKAEKHFRSDVRIGDSGTTAAWQALKEGFEIWCVGIDLGGWDIYSPEHEKQNKAIWVMRWKRLYKFYKDKIHWIGQDHTEILRSPNITKYSSLYTNGKIHIRDEKSRKAIEKFINKN